MDKKNALITLIEASLLLTAEVKRQLTEKIDSFNAEQIDALGTFLATEQKEIVSAAEHMQSSLKIIIDELEKQDATE